MIYFFLTFLMFDPMSDLTGGTPADDKADATAPPPPPAPGSSSSSGSSDGSGGGQYGKEIHSITIRAKQRTFYIDLKESSNGKFFKVSEKSRGGRKTTIMFDAEDLGAFVDALTEMKTKL
jgi:hypothetical protein